MPLSNRAGELSLETFIGAHARIGSVGVAEIDRGVSLEVPSSAEEPQPVTNDPAAEGAFVLVPKLIETSRRSDRGRHTGDRCVRLIRIGDPLRIGHAVAERPGEIIAA